MTTTSIRGPISITEMNPPSFTALLEEAEPDQISIPIETPKIEVTAKKASTSDKVYAAFEGLAQSYTIATAIKGMLAVIANNTPKDKVLKFFQRINFGINLDTCKSFIRMKHAVGGKSALFSRMVLKAPLKEELLFRLIIQNILLKQIPRALSKKEDRPYYDSSKAKITRILISSTLFSLVHLINLKVLPPSYVIPQVIGAFVAGIALGTIQEGRLGTLGSIGLHALNNYSAYSFTRIICNSMKK